MPIDLNGTILARMQPNLSSTWMLFVLPFASSGVLAHARLVRKLSAKHNRLTVTLGVLGLGAFVAGIVGLLPFLYS